MKRTLSILLCLAFCVGCCLPLTACGTDESGEWYAYYEAFCFFEGEMSDETVYLSLDYNEIEQENQSKLYERFYEYCEDKSRFLYEGGAEKLMENMLSDSTSGLYKSAYAVKFSNVKWAQDRKSVTMSVSLNASPTVHEANLGGNVLVQATDEGWQVSRTKDSALLSSKETAGMYCTIIRDMFDYTDSIGTVRNKYICLDPTDIEKDCVPQIRAYLEDLFGRHGLAYMEATWDELKSNGYIEGSTFSSGYQFVFDLPTGYDDGKTVEIYAWFKRGELEAGGGIYTMTLEDTGWVITNVDRMVS